MKVWQQVTTGKIHRKQRCGISSRTRYLHSEREVTAEQLADMDKCDKCWAGHEPAQAPAELLKPVLDTIAPVVDAIIAACEAADVDFNARPDDIDLAQLDWSLLVEVNASQVKLSVGSDVEGFYAYEVEFTDAPINVITYTAVAMLMDGDERGQGPRIAL